MIMKNQLLNFSPLLLSLVALTACGGGGGGGTPANTTSGSYSATCSDGSTKTSSISQADADTQCPTNTNSTTSIVTTIQASTYPANSEELAAFNLLNQERAFCGFGKLEQDTRLDQSAWNHAKYLSTNNRNSHYEDDASLPGYTGYAPSDRIKAVGFIAQSSYAGTGEGITTKPITTNITGAGIWTTRGLMSAPYHLKSMFRGYRNVGIDIALTSEHLAGGEAAIGVFNYGTLASSSIQLPSSTEILTYPCEGHTGANYKMAQGETPSPVPGRNFGVNPIGTPILVNVRYGNTLTLTSATLTKVTTSASIPLRTPLSTKATDINASYMHSNEGFIIPDVALEPNTRYRAVINGTNNGVAFTKDFTFTTGSGGNYP